MKRKAKKGFSFAYEYAVMFAAITGIGVVIFGAAAISYCFLPAS